MAEDKGFFSETWERITGLASSVFRHNIAEKTSTSISHAIGSTSLGFGVGSLVNLYASYREYKHEEGKLRDFFAPEIAEIMHKPIRDVSVDDLQTAGKLNPTIEEAINRNKKTRNLNFAINTISLLVAVPVTAAVLTMIFPGAAPASLLTFAGIKMLATGMAVGLGLFLAVEKPLEAIGKKLFNLEEPTITVAARSLSKMQALSLPSQIHCIEHMQQHNVPVTHDHVMTTFIAADPVLDLHIANNYGGQYAQLPPQIRARVVKEIGSNYNVEAIANDLSSRQMRAQELAFAIHGQSSGKYVPVVPAPLSQPEPQAAEDTAPSFSYRTKIIEERKAAARQAEQEQPAAPAQNPVADGMAYRTMVIEERKAAAVQPQAAAVV